MKKLMMFGAMTSVAVMAGFGIQQRRDPTEILLQSGLAATGGALLMRWWSRLVVRNWREAAAQSRRNNGNASPSSTPRAITPSHRI